MNSKKLKIYTDGGSRGNPGPTASAFLIYQGDTLLEKGSKYLGISTNNVAEYTALLLSLQKLIEIKGLDYESVEVFMDSELAVKQLNGLYKVKNENLKTLHNKIKSIIADNNLKVNFIHVRRSGNKESDRLVNIELDENK